MEKLSRIVSKSVSSGLVAMAIVDTFTNEPKNSVIISALLLFITLVSKPEKQMDDPESVSLKTAKFKEIKARNKEKFEKYSIPSIAVVYFFISYLTSIPKVIIFASYFSLTGMNYVYCLFAFVTLGGLFLTPRFIRMYSIVKEVKRGRFP